MVARPYVPDSMKPEGASQHAIVRRLAPNPLDHPALRQIMQAANEIADELGKTADTLTDGEADRAIELGKQRHAEGQ